VSKINPIGDHPMPAISLLRAPAHARSGDDAFSQRFADALSHYFPKVTLRDIWPDWHNRCIQALPMRLLPFRHALYSRTLLRRACGKTVRSLAADSTVCVRGELLPGDKTAFFERETARTHRYIYNLIDNWFAIPQLATNARVRCEIAHAVIVPTERLRDVCSELFPKHRIFCVEEPVNADRFNATAGAKADVPTLVWAGNPYSQPELEALRDTLAEVYQTVPFKLCVLSGYQKPRVRLDIPWEWIPFSPANEQRVIPQAWAGFCFLRDDDYSLCKGCYKMKTYMTAGTVPIVTNAGHAHQVLTAAGTGTLVNGNAPAAWKAALLASLTSRDEAIRGGEAARRYAQTHFDFQTISASWADVIHQSQ
jgi:glycosyltransferase involved in cell wall biosynthesis